MTTILVDQDLCTWCGSCSVVCSMGVIDPAEENTLPKVQEAKAGICIRCGHCAAHCRSQALLVIDRPDEKVPLPAGAGTIAPGEMGF
jgi:ferredoxin